MIALECLKICIPTQESFQEVVLLRCKCRRGLTSKLANMKVLSNYHSEQVNFIIILVGYALEIIPKTLASNCGMDVVRIITELRAKHA